MIPRVAHFVFGLEEQPEPFHFLHYLSLESCRRVLQPEAIYFHHRHVPWGPWWERIRPHLTLAPVDAVPEVVAYDYGRGEEVPERYRYAHHADFIRLDVLVTHGGIYADIDTVFLQPFPEELFAAPFVIGREPPVRHERSGELLPSLCNALLMAEPGAEFARSWRAQMAAALDGTWSNHSGFLPDQLAQELPTAVRVEPVETFFSFGATRPDLYALLESVRPVPAQALSVHLWAHLWWEQSRTDFSTAHAGWYVPEFVRWAPTTLSMIARPYLASGPLTGEATGAAEAEKRQPPPERWSYLSNDETSGYGIGARNYMNALATTGVELEWLPFVRGAGWRLGYQPALADDVSFARANPVLVARLVPEFLPLVRARAADAFLVSQTVWDTDRLPAHWIPALGAADLVTVPSRFSASAMQASPIAPPVEIVPHVAMPIPERVSLPAGVPDDVIVFYTIGEWNARKDIESTIEAFLRAFTRRDPVMLIVKTAPYDQRFMRTLGGAASQGTAAWSLARVLARHPAPPEVRLITRHLSDAEIAGLHTRGDCFVSLCHSEGWGLGAFDAALHGNPVVITGYGGQLDYLEGSPYLIRYDLVPVIDPAGGASFTPDMRWAQADIDHGAELLSQVAGDITDARALAAAHAPELQERFSPQRVGAALREAIDRHRAHAAGGIRTHTSSRTMDFESTASAVPPPPRSSQV